MSRQHAAPILVPDGPGTALPLVQASRGSDGVNEAWIQDLVQRHPECLPIAEIDPIFANPVPLCTELSTPAGSIDNIMVTASGLPVLVECKLWRNPEGRREVIGQILDYAKELTRWTVSDLQREVRRRVGGNGDPLLRLLSAAGHTVEEIAFNDALTQNLRRGRFLLLIVGDGIREGVEAIAEYVQRHLGLQLSLGLVEMPVFHNPAGGYLVTPRVVARTAVITRHVISLPDGLGLAESDDGRSGETGELPAALTEPQRFWAEFLGGLRLDDPEQPVPRPSKLGYVTFSMPTPAGSSWITVWRNMKRGELGLTLSWGRGTVGEVAGQGLIEGFEDLGPALGGSARVSTFDGKATLSEHLTVGDLSSFEVRQRAFTWLRERLNVWVNELRPRIRSLAADRSADDID